MCGAVVVIVMAKYWVVVMVGVVVRHWIVFVVGVGFVKGVGCVTG